MPFRVLITLWMLIPASVFSVAAGAASAHPAADDTVTPQQMKQIVGALREGNVPELAELYRHPPNAAMRVLAAMSLERIHFHLDRATHDAQVCEDALIDSQPRVAYFCAVFANGNLRLSGKVRAADRAEIDLARRFAGKVDRLRLERVRHFVDERKRQPAMRVAHEPAGTTFTVALGRVRDTWMGTITVAANGATLALKVDTGSSYITLDHKWAGRLGVRMTGKSGRGRGFLTHDIDVRYGVLDKLTFAGVTLEHVPVMVVPGKHRLIGIDILRQLGSLRLGKERITVYGRDATRPACRQPMLVGSDLWGNHVRMLTALPVNGKLQTMLVDTGSDAFLAASHGAMKTVVSGHNARRTVKGLGARTHHARVSQATIETVISGQPFQVKTPVYKDARMPWSFILGSGALRYMDLYFDFDHARTCLLLHEKLR